MIAYDSRAHGRSGGDACTYGYFEKHDLRRVIDTVSKGPVILIGSSLGGAVAFQEAAGDRRVTAIVAAETFSDLRKVATERAPFFFSQNTVDESFRIAESDGRFQIDEVSPLKAARETKIPILLIHGADDRDTPPSHSKKLFAALSPDRHNKLILIRGAAHNQSLRTNATWQEIERWVDSVVGDPATK